MLTFLQQLVLVKHKYAVLSQNGNLTTFKYSRKVFLDNLWNDISGIMECRGHTYDNVTGELVLAAPTKTFNYGENGHWSNLSLDTPVVLYKKYNGFMATVTKYNDQIIVGTTGSTKSDFAKLAKKVLIEKYTEAGLYNLFNLPERITMLFEICDVSDPHIVYEKPDAYYLGTRYHESNARYNRKEWHFDPCGDVMLLTLGESLQLAKTEQNIEGWMVYQNDHSVCKLKTDHYVNKKRLMRMNQSRVIQMYKGHHSFTSEYWKDVIHSIISHIPLDTWLEMRDQQRRNFIESITKCQK